MLAGEIMNVGGLSRRIVDCALALVGHIKRARLRRDHGAAVLLSALSGSAVADAAALNGVPAADDGQGRPRQGALGRLIAAAGVIGPVSAVDGFVIFGSPPTSRSRSSSVAGIFPGILIGAALWFTWCGSVGDEQAAPPPRKSRDEVWTARASRPGR